MTRRVPCHADLESGNYTLDSGVEAGGLNLWRSLSLRASPDAPKGSVVLDRAAGATGRVVCVCKSEIEVIIEGIRITGGVAVSENGGGILNKGNLTLIDVLIQSNKATGTFPEGCGGGLNNAQAIAYLVNTTITENTADNYGGGILDGASGGPASGTHNNVYNSSTIEGNHAQFDPDVSVNPTDYPWPPMPPSGQCLSGQGCFCQSDSGTACGPYNYKCC